MRKPHRSYVRATAALVACGIVVAASAQVSATTEPPPGTEPASTAPAATEPAATTAPAAPTEVERQPLTGVPIDGTLVTYTPRPALIVKIDNGVNSHPQTGLNQADIVFEEIVEGITRFAAVFNSTDSDPVGNIRSGRTQDVELFASFNDPIFAYSGGNSGVNGALGATGWTLLTQGNGMFRVDGRGGAPYNLYGNTSEFFAQAGDSGEAVPQFEYIAPGTEVAGNPVSSIDINMMGGHTVQWAWDAEQGLFLRSENGSAHQLVDGQATANTVIILSVPYGQSPAGGVPEAQTTGTGSVVVYTAGHKIEGTWTRNDASDPFALTDASGAPILLTPGRTWVELANSASSTFTDA